MAAQPQFADARDGTQTAVIANGASLSAGVDLAGSVLCGLITPAVLDAADLTFAVSNDGVTYYPLYRESDDAEVKIATAIVATGEARAYSLTPADFAGWRYVKVRSGVNGTAVPVGAQRTFKLVVRPV